MGAEDDCRRVGLTAKSEEAGGSEFEQPVRRKEVGALVEVGRKNSWCWQVKLKEKL